MELRQHLRKLLPLALGGHGRAAAQVRHAAAHGRARREREERVAAAAALAAGLQRLGLAVQPGARGLEREHARGDLLCE